MPPKPLQLDLIDVLPENVKKIRAAIRKRDEAHSEHLEKKKESDEWDKKIWELVQANGGALNGEGELSLKISNDEVLKIKRGEARLSITVKTPKKKEESDDEEDPSGDDKDGNTAIPREPPPAPNRKGKHE